MSALAAAWAAALVAGLLALALTTHERQAAARDLRAPPAAAGACRPLCPGGRL